LISCTKCLPQEQIYVHKFFCYSHHLLCHHVLLVLFFFFQAEDGIRDDLVTGVQTCALPISTRPSPAARERFRLSPTRFAETLTLLSTLPTLCRTLVATSAMPACLEASRSCCCRMSSRCSAAIRSVTSRSMPTRRAPPSDQSLTTAATDSPCPVLPSGRTR